MTSILTLFLALAAAQAAATTDTAPDVSPEALEACEALPPAEQPACIEPFLDQLPDEFAALMRKAMDPKVQADMKAWEAGVNELMHARARMLAARGTPRDQLAAVLAWPMTFPDDDGTGHEVPAEVQGWFEAARQATPPDPLVAWVEATDCSGLATDCDQAAALERLLQADAGNAAAHLLAAARSHVAGDADAMRTHLAHAADAPRFESYDQQLLELMFATHQGIDWPTMSPDLAQVWGRAFGLGGVMTAEDWGLTRMMGYWMAMVNPIAGIPYCSGLPVEAAPDFRADCIAVLGMLADDGDSLMNQAVALPALVRLTSDTEAAATWRERLRQHYWLLEKGLMRGPGNPGSGMSALEYITHRVTDGEPAGLRVFLGRIGEPEYAPEDWLPEHPFHRSQVAPETGDASGE